MKKIILATIIAALTAPSAIANDIFIGGGIGSHSTKAEISGYGLKESKTANNAAFHIRAGTYLTENHRLTGTINFVGQDELLSASYGQESISADLGQTEFLFSYDYVHSINEDFSLFGGGSAGFINNKLDANYTDQSAPQNNISASENETDFTLGFQVGGQYKIDKNLSADLQYRRMFESYSYTENGIKTSVPNSGEFTISIDYRF